MKTAVDRVYAFQPGYGAGNPISHRQFWANSFRRGGPLDGRCTLVHGGGSLLANTFNQAWVHALNLQESGTPITHFAMLHDDVSPDDGWLDILLDDLQKNSADVVSAVIPIKDPFGTTSTAIDDPADVFNVERRLTMAEVFELPPVFTSNDCGYPYRALLVNTGCWVCDFTKPWRFEITFTIRDRIRKNEKGKWVAEVAPEDWNFSRQLHSAGAKVMATRNVKLSHWGQLPYRNSEAWGEWNHDEIFAHKFGGVPITGTKKPHVKESASR